MHILVHAVAASDLSNARALRLRDALQFISPPVESEMNGRGDFASGDGIFENLAKRLSNTDK